MSGEAVVLEGTIHDVLHLEGQETQIVFTPDPDYAAESWFNANDEAHVRITIEPVDGGGDGA